MTDLYDLVSAIEFKELPDQQREDYISKLNIYGYNEERIEGAAKELWQNFFRNHMEEILKGSDPIESHLLSSEVIKECLQIAFEEFKNRKKDLGIDDISKYWFPI